MKKGLKFFAISVLLFVIPISAVFAQRGSANEQVTNIRFVSALPRNSDWGRALDRLAADWKRVTHNQVNVIMTHGSQSSEAALISSLRSNSIQVAVLSSAGMYEICPAVMNISVPFLINNNTELDLVLNDLKPVLESRVRDEFIVIAWSKAGWLYVFSKEPVVVPNDLRRLRLATSAELVDMNTVFRTLGFTMVETDWSSLGTRLASNMITAFYYIPTAVTPMNLHRGLHMLDLPIAPIMGAIVMNRVTWNQLSPANQQEIIKVTQQVATQFDNAMARSEVNAKTEMEKNGLVVNRPTPTQQNIWLTDLQNAIPTLVGTIFDRDLYNRINGILQRARGR